MLFGFPLIIHCPQCNHKHARTNLMSGNTFGGIFWSDGSFFAPMLPDLPAITRCSNCGRIFSIAKAVQQEAGNFEETDGLPDVSHLSPDDINEALESGFFTETDEKIYLRRRLWWSMNDHPFESECLADSRITSEYHENAAALLDLLSGDSSEYLIMRAELLRNLGDFAGCLNNLSKINDPSLETRKKQITEACAKRISGTIRIS